MAFSLPMLYLVFLEFLLDPISSQVEVFDFRVCRFIDFVSMDKWKNAPLSKEEEESVTIAVDEVCGEEIFQHTLVGKLWTDNNFNSRPLRVQ